ncbi:MAG: DUF5615 family PIN-like protein [Halobacteriales archaeon]|jgi:predicted nuclease of predicted toxin-antitoxin system
MSYRILCDEHVEPQTTRYLSRSGHDAVHVRETLSLGVDDDSIAAYAVAEDRVLLTNDRGFLDETEYPGISVLCYTNNQASAYDLNAMIVELAEYYPTQSDLPRVVFLPSTVSE